jgi:adenine deaminase
MASGLRAGIAVTEDEALRWVTLNPAWALGIDHRVGSIEPGKDGDVVLWSKSPFSVYALAEKVWIDGVIAYERGKPRWSDFELGQEPPLLLAPPAPGGPFDDEPGHGGGRPQPSGPPRILPSPGRKP